MAVSCRRLVGAPLGLLLACSDGQKGQVDGAADGSLPDSPSVPDGGLQTLGVDFTVTGCPRLDPSAPRCDGVAPLTVAFVPVTSPSVGTFLWDFGDQTPRSSLQTPVHTFTSRGSYDVSLTVAAAADTASRTRVGFIVAEPSPTGGLCDGDAQCEDGRRCLCVPGTMGCPAAFARGVCTAACPSDCGTDGVCADLGLSVAGDPAAAGEPWRRALCLRACQGESDCAPGLRCRMLPGGDGVPWVRACFLPATPVGIGGPCRSANGQLKATMCVTGHCTDLGALGMCSLDCRMAGCPDGSRCAELGDGRAVCLRGCTTAAECGEDPLIGCEMPGAPGELGFSVAGAIPGSRFCAPRRCRDARDCAPAGLCRPNNGGHCTHG